jgi:hypothetical protein
MKVYLRKKECITKKIEQIKYYFLKRNFTFGNMLLIPLTTYTMITGN